MIYLPYKKVLILIIIIGIILTIIEITKNSVKCNNNNIIYRYLPRTFKEEQNEPVFVTDIFKTMFSQPGVWEAGMGARAEEDKKVEQINKFFVSQT